MTSNHMHQSDLRRLLTLDSMLFQYVALIEQKTKLPGGKTLLINLAPATCTVCTCFVCNRCSHTTSSCFVVTSNSIICRRAANPCEGSDGSQKSPLHSGEDTVSAAQAWNNLTCYDANGPRSNALQGSRIYKDNIAAANDALIDVLEDSGAIVIGKTNTPEFGAGANTFNEYAKLRFMVPAFSRFLDPASPDPACAAHHANQPLIIRTSAIPLLHCS